MNLTEEKKQRKKGYKFIVGIDEAGRGALAGPVIAAAVMVSDFKFKDRALKRETKDSKELSPKKRKELYNVIVSDSQIKWGTGKVGPKVIDRINIFEATKLAMKRAINSLETKLEKELGFSNKKIIDFLILDGNFKISSKIPQKSVIKGDKKVFSCALASIIAKVTRDRIMEKYQKKYPQYNFEKHKGYPTQFHKQILNTVSFCSIHRLSFGKIGKLKKPIEKKDFI